MKSKPAINDLLAVMAKLRSPEGCPWDREQDHLSLRTHAVEEVYELMDAIEAGDDHEMAEELGDLLLQVVFHCQLARERGVTLSLRSRDSGLEPRAGACDVTRLERDARERQKHARRPLQKRARADR